MTIDEQIKVLEKRMENINGNYTNDCKVSLNAIANAVIALDILYKRKAKSIRRPLPKGPRR